jgi:hypothetical protein
MFILEHKQQNAHNYKNTNCVDTPYYSCAA